MLLEPMITDVDEWFSALDQYDDVEFMPAGREQPRMPANEDLFA